MTKTIQPTAAPAYIYNNTLLPVDYSFAAYTEPHRSRDSKVWLDILFMHPVKDEPIKIRIAKSSLILCQPKEVIEAIVHREVRDFLELSYTTSNLVLSV